MKDVIMFVGVFIIGYLVSVGVFYVAFRIFFPVVVEKESELNVEVTSENAKISRNSSVMKTNTQLLRVKLVHG